MNSRLQGGDGRCQFQINVEIMDGARSTIIRVSSAEAPHDKTRNSAASFYSRASNFASTLALLVGTFLIVECGARARLALRP